jgi:hypothetical protein
MDALFIASVGYSQSISAADLFISASSTGKVQLAFFHVVTLEPSFESLR